MSAYNTNNSSRSAGGGVGAGSRGGGGAPLGAANKADLFARGPVGAAAGSVPVSANPSPRPGTCQQLYP
jgi:hypothetical protein